MMKCQRKSGLSLSKLQSPITTRWLHENYEIQDGVSLPRNSLYTHYLDFCNKTLIEPVNAASFGKIIRTTFPDLKTRRLGTRGQSKYHYYGISVKKCSQYYNDVLIAAREDMETTVVQNPSPLKSELDLKKEIFKPPPRVVTPIKSNYESPPINETSGTILPDFPSADTVDLNDVDTNDKVKTFLIMYKAHCQRILDTIIRANFAEVQNFLIHFWQGMPSHIAVILSKPAVIELIGSCDHLLYKSIGGVLIPGIFQPLPASLTQAIQNFAKQLCVWLEVALYQLPEDLQTKKMAVARHFSQLLLRQTSLSHLAQAARTVLHNEEPVTQMALDLDDINFHAIMTQFLWLTSDQKPNYQNIIKKFLDEFRLLLEDQATIEEFAAWISSLVTRCLLKPSEKDQGSFQSLAQEFLLNWGFITSKIIQELTLRSAQSFGSFHLLQMLFDDYIYFLIESHADIYEETADATAERLVGCRTTSASCNEVTYNSRYSPCSSSGRGSLSPEKCSNSDMFNFPTQSMDQNYKTNNYPLKQPFFHYDSTKQYDDYTWENNGNTTERLSYENPHATNQYSNKKYESYTTSKPSQPYTYLEESEYSNDLDIVRVLQERTRSLMETAKPDQEIRCNSFNQATLSNLCSSNTMANQFQNLPLTNASMYSYI